MAFYKHFAKRNRNKFGITIKKKFAQKIVHMVYQYGEDISSVMEIGPGDGYIAELITNKEISYVAVEASREIAEDLRSKKYHIYNQFVPPLPGEVNDIDVCIALHVLEHMDGHHKASLLLQNIHSKLKPGGLVIIACPDYYRWGKLFFDCDYTHSFPVTMRRLKQLLANEGFDVLFKSHYTGSWIGSRYLAISAFIRWLYCDILSLFLFPGSDLLYRGILTFMPNLIFVARKPEKI